MSILSKTKYLFQKKQLLMSMVSFGSLYIAAEVTQQLILLRVDPTKKSMDWKSVGNYATMGIVGIGPTLFYWYRILDFFLPGSGIRAMRKVIVDQLIGAPVITAMFFTGMSLLEGKEDVFAELKAKFLSTYAVSCCFWLPAQAINFCFLPPYTRVAYVGCASFLWVNILCLIKRKEVPTSDSIETSSDVKAS
ncbi:mpv17-like protein isoform X1 [Parasteatoda tepidariorum]|uniref:mpv17-like protein isoform X1 n=1 Tax=Parasteatoda tepidariorum TaxID=114398 RepID=UPI00077FC58B|nr:mpv17-like protein isoform X1 [Parasteatoda tepidariorum]